VKQWGCYLGRCSGRLGLKERSHGDSRSQNYHGRTLTSVRRFGAKGKVLRSQHCQRRTVGSLWRLGMETWNGGRNYSSQHYQGS